MVTFLGRRWLVNRVIVVDQVRVPLVCLGAQEPVVALEAPAAGPVPARRGEVHLVSRAQVPIAHEVGVPAPLAQDLREHAVFRWDRAARVGEPDGRLGDAGHAVAGVVAAGEQAGARRRAQRRRMPLGIADAVGGDAVNVGGLDRPAIAAERGKADVIQHDVEDIGRAFRRLGGFKRFPVGLGIADVEVDPALERFGHGFRRSLCSLRFGLVWTPF